MKNQVGEENSNHGAGHSKILGQGEERKAAQAYESKFGNGGNLVGG